MGAPLPGTPEWQSYLRRTVLEAFARFEKPVLSDSEDGD